MSQRPRDPDVRVLGKGGADAMDMKKRARETASGRQQRSRGPAMATRVVEPSLDTLDDLDADTLAIGLTTDGRPLVGAAGFVDWRLCGQLSRLLLRGVVTGASGERVLVPTQGRLPVPRLLLFGFGAQAQLETAAVERLAWMAGILLDAGSQKIVVALPEPALPLLPLVDAHLKPLLGEKLVAVFEAD